MSLSDRKGRVYDGHVVARGGVHTTTEFPIALAFSSEPDADLTTRR
jgi:hypothetical protein